ncbi:uncharacterized protein LOC141853296 [Brevipalpus obovatus]|uniref:uncharacterized protein LOC141853296 n=1 Tax=Brevipalpus obovatus TaxID=246614 RepID=UPI003D9E1B21
MDAKLLDVKMIIKALVITSQNGMDITTLDNEYYEQEGAHIPFQQFGFSNLTDFLHSIGDSVRFDVNKANQRVLFPILDASTVHIRKFVEEQRPQAIKRRPPPLQDDYGKRTRHVSNNNGPPINRMVETFPARRSPSPYRRPRSPSPIPRGRYRSPSRSPPRTYFRRSPSRSPSPPRSRRRSSSDHEKSHRSSRRHKSRSRDRSQERRSHRSSRDRRSSREPKKKMVSCEVQTDLEFSLSEPPKENIKADNFLASIATNQTFFDVAQDQSVSSSIDTPADDASNLNQEPMDMDLADDWSIPPATNPGSDQIIDWSDAIQPIPDRVGTIQDSQMSNLSALPVKPADPRLNKRNQGFSQQQVLPRVTNQPLDDWGEPVVLDSVHPPSASNSRGPSQKFPSSQPSNNWTNSGWNEIPQQSTVDVVPEEKNPVNTRALFLNYKVDPWSVFDYYFCIYGDDWLRTGLLMPPDFEALCEEDPLVPHPGCPEEDCAKGKYFNYETGRYDDVVMIPLTFFDFLHSHYFNESAPRPPPVITPQKPLQPPTQPVKRISLTDYMSRSKQPAASLGPPPTNPSPAIGNNVAPRDPRMKRLPNK